MSPRGSWRPQRGAGRRDPRQLTIDWTAAVAAAPEPPAPVPEPVPETDPASPLQVLSWDFAATFPPVLQDALDAGVVEEEDAEPEGVAALHGEHVREMLAALSELDAVCDARRQGVNPATGKAARTPATKRKLSEKLDREVERLERWQRSLLDVYETAFGARAAEAFGKYVRARHAGIKVMAIAESPACLAPDLPVSKPLPASVHAGVFGHDEAGPIEPGEEEVQAITQRHAEVVTELIAAFRRTQPAPGAVDPSVRTAIEKYATDFGREAAGALLEHCRRQALLQDARPIRSLHRP